MKVLFFILFAIAMNAQGGIISKTVTVVESDGIFYEFTTRIVDNATPFPDTLKPKRTIGDSTALMEWASNQTEARYNEVGIGVQEAFKIRQARQLFTSLNAIISSATGGLVTLQNLLNARYADHYGARVAADTLNGRYRLNVNGAPVFARMVKLANGSYRLRVTTSANGPDASPQVQYIVSPRSKGNFTITYPVGGTDYSMWLNQLESAPDRLEYRSLENLLPGVAPVVRSIVKLK